MKLLCEVPNEVYIAFSGGVDSLVAAHFFKRGRKKVHLLHFHHGCQYSDAIMEECKQRADELGLPLTVGVNDAGPPTGISLEEFWRDQRYKFLKPYSQIAPVVTCHHLDDAVETWVWSALHGEPKLIPVRRRNFIRPFLVTEKQWFISYAERHGLVPVHDPYNEEYHLTRNYIRRNIIPHALHINPGLRKVIRKKYLCESHL